MCDEIGEELREEFEIEYGKNHKTKYGQYLDMSKQRNGSGKYNSMVTFYAWAAFRHGRGLYNPNGGTNGQ